MSAVASRDANHGGWSLANTVTVIRMLLIPVFLCMMLIDWAMPLVGENAARNVGPWACVVLYALISLTDSLDGYLARSRNEITVFGKFMDPIADKLLVVSALIVLVEAGSLPSWIPIVIVARELLVSGLRMVVAAAGVVVAASWIGKAKTFVTLVAICLFIVKDTPVLTGLQPWASILAWALMIVAVVLTVWSMIDYFAKTWQYLATGDQGSHDADKAAYQPMTAGLAGAGLEGIHPLAADVIRVAAQRDIRIGTAESCTGGLVSAALTSVPGSSAVVCGGVASYMPSVKEGVLAVPHAVIEGEGVVSGPCAIAMAQGARMRLGADIAVSTTGVAGPAGGDERNPVGSVWFGIADATGTEADHVVFQGTREQVRAQAVDHALQLLLDRIERVR